MIFKVGEDRFVMCVVSAAKKIALAKVKRVLNVKNACLASKEETLRLTRCLVSWGGMMFSGSSRADVLGICRLGRYPRLGRCLRGKEWR